MVKASALKKKGFFILGHTPSKVRRYDNTLDLLYLKRTGDLAGKKVYQFRGPDDSVLLVPEDSIDMDK